MVSYFLWSAVKRWPAPGVTDHTKLYVTFIPHGFILGTDPIVLQPMAVSNPNLPTAPMAPQQHPVHNVVYVEGPVVPQVVQCPAVSGRYYC